MGEADSNGQRKLLGKETQVLEVGAVAQKWLVPWESEQWAISNCHAHHPLPHFPYPFQKEGLAVSLNFL